MTTIPHEDLILWEAVIVFEAYARLQVPHLSSSPACVPASAGVRSRDRAPTSRIARIMRPVLGDACWAAVMAHANAWLQCAVSGDSPGLSAISQCGNAATGMCCAVCAAWKVLEVRGAGAEASESTRVKHDGRAASNEIAWLQAGQSFVISLLVNQKDMRLQIRPHVRPVGSKHTKGVVSICDLYRQSA